MGETQKEPERKKRVRIVMKDSDREVLRKNLAAVFRLCGADDNLIADTITHGSLGMETWMQRWITHHTDYVKNGLTQDAFRMGFFAWIRYKVTAEVVDRLEITDETRKWADRVYGREQKEEKGI